MHLDAIFTKICQEMTILESLETLAAITFILHVRRLSRAIVRYQCNFFHTFQRND